MRGRGSAQHMDLAFALGIRDSRMEDKPNGKTEQWPTKLTPKQADLFLL